jgi:hypothetical protein
MNSLVALPIVAAMPVAAPAMPSTIAADPSGIDAELVQATFGLQAADQALSDFIKKYGDDAVDREDYLAMEDTRNEHIATLITVPAQSATGVQAKAACVRLRALIEDFDQHQQVAVSLADDIVERGAPAWRSGEQQLDPVYAAIEEYEKTYVNCRAAVAESNRLCDLADKVAGKHEVIIPDLRGPDAEDSRHLRVVYQNGQKCVVADTTVIVKEYLPGEENEQLRQSFVSRLDDIQKARKAVYGDIDEVISGPAEAEWEAIDDLVETVPTTLPGLLAMLACVAKIYEREEGIMVDDRQVAMLLPTLAKAAATLS